MSDSRDSAIPIPFIDLGAQRERLGPGVEEAILTVVRHGAYVMGPEVGQLEADLAAFSGAQACRHLRQRHRRARRPGAGWPRACVPADAVLCPSFTFARGRRRVIAWLGGPRRSSVDVREDTFNLDIDSLEAGLAHPRPGTGAQSGRRDPGGSVRPARGLRADRGLVRHARTSGCSQMPPRASARPIRGARSARSAMAALNQLLSRQAARLLWPTVARSSPMTALSRSCSRSLRNHGQGRRSLRLCPASA